jgi:hypothetical protein
MLPLATLVFILLANVTESTLVLHNSTFWVLFVAIAVHVRNRRESRTGRLPATPIPAPAHALAPYPRP